MGGGRTGRLGAPVGNGELKGTRSGIPSGADRQGIGFIDGRAGEPFCQYDIVRIELLLSKVSFDIQAWLQETIGVDVKYFQALSF